MPTYNLDQYDQSESFEFTLGGNKYNFRYPTGDELDKFKEFADEQGNVDAEKLQAEIASYITPAEKESPNIVEALGKAKAPTIKHFSKMVATELGLE